MKIEIGLLISIFGALLAFLGYLLNKNKVNKEKLDKSVSEEKERTQVLTTINVKLDNIGQHVGEIRLDNKEISKNVTDLSNRMSLVEQKIQNHDKRLDKLEDRN